ncbi:MAG: glucose-6-phosphate isomerase [Verrucomicrobia bacterium CG1_02_43_26]|nr:MAG: glucose-6-phosphate isomerase [Verrucomicrobia bacterium CG1_02_43_26]
MAFSQTQVGKEVMDWKRFKEYYCEVPAVGFSIDVSRINFKDTYLKEMEVEMQKAYKSMEALERGGIANPDEQRMVGHYWLRDSELAPTADIMLAIDENLDKISSFAAEVHAGKIIGQKGPFQNIVVVGIGGSALGPQFVADAFTDPKTNQMKPYFIDNTDPDGIDLVLSQLDGKLGETLVIVISKSGGTTETHNGMEEMREAYTRAGLDFTKHAVAVTGEGSKLDKFAKDSGWITCFALWDWVGGRTSELSAVGLLPAALQGIDIKNMLEGAKMMDQATRIQDTKKNPAALLALMWYHATGGKGLKDMVILPYKDRLKLFSKYLQQLVMESLGKEKDLNGNVVHQGIAVYGNKGSTDQHAYVQQLRDGVNNFYVTFIEVLKDRQNKSIEMEPGVTTGDYLHGFMLGTREALSDKDRESITVTVNDVSPFTVGALIALYERAVGFYASLVGINAYHQPGVEAGKKAAANTIELQKKVTSFLTNHPKQTFSAEVIAEQIGAKEKTETVFKLLEHMAANPDKKVTKTAYTPFYNNLYAYNPV